MTLKCVRTTNTNAGQYSVTSKTSMWSDWVRFLVRSVLFIVYEQFTNLQFKLKGVVGQEKCQKAKMKSPLCHLNGTVCGECDKASVSGVRNTRPNTWQTMFPVGEILLCVENPR